MRILAVSTLAHVAGGELMLLRVLPRLARRGHRVRLAVPGDGRLLEAARALDIETTRIPLGPPDRRTSAAAVGLLMALRELPWADAVWLNGLPTERLVPALVLCRRRAVLRVNNPLAAAPAAWRRPGFWRAVAVVTADSAASARECVAAGAPVDRVHAVLPPAWGDADPPEPHTPDGNLRVGFVGTIEPRKGVLELIQAAVRFLADRPRATLTVIGDPPPGQDPGYAARVREAASSSNVSDQIEFRGYLADAAAEIGGFDLLVVPSLAEPFGTVAAEAGARGVPVVASEVGGLPEVVGSGGVLVPPGEPRALGRAVAHLLDDAAWRAALGEQALAEARRFDPARSAETMERLLLQAAGARR